MQRDVMHAGVGVRVSTTPNTVRTSASKKNTIVCNLSNPPRERIE